MLDIKKEWEDCDGYMDYNVLLDSFEYKRLIQHDDDDYSGDSYVLFYDLYTDRYGYLIFGWGSCSGCDALMGCETCEEVEELQQKLYNQIRWFDSLDEIQDYFKTKDWECDWFGHSSTIKSFIKDVIEYKRGE